MTASVSVIVAVRNAERTLERCLRSVRTQDYPTIELIVVNNQSEDGTAKIAQGYADRVIEEGGRLGIHRNVGVASSSGQWILYVDGDMTLEKGLVTECVKLCTSEGFGALVIAERSSGANFWGRARAFERNHYRGDLTVESPRFLARKWYDLVGGFREDLTGFEDMAMTSELRSRGCKIGITTRLILHDEGAPTLISVFRKKQFWGRNLLQYRRSYPEAFHAQATVRTSWLRPRTVLEHPALTAGVWTLKVVDALGYLAGSLDAIKGDHVRSRR